MPYDWQKWCRLCGKIDVKNVSLKIEAIPNLIFLIQKHFAVLVSVYKFYQKMSSNSIDTVLFCHLIVDGIRLYIEYLCGLS